MLDGHPIHGNKKEKKMANNETEFSSKLKKLCSNRAVIVTVVTLLVATGIILAITVSANRASRPTPGKDPVATTPATGAPAGTEPVVKDETLPTYNGAETLPTGGNPDDTPVDGQPDQFTLPVTGKLMKAHDPTIQVFSNTMGDYRVHLGVDIATAAEAPVYAAADGKIEKVWNDALMGTCLAIAHADDTVTVYKNLAVELAAGITEGVSVKQGQEIARVGDTAALEMADEPHLHFEMTVGGIAVDPLKYFSEASIEALSKDTAFESSAVTETTAESMLTGK